MDNTLKLKKNVLIEFDGAEGGSFWLYDESDDDCVQVPLGETRELVNFLNKYINYKKA